MIHYIFSAALILFVILFGWMIKSAGFGPKGNALFGILIAAILAALGWTYFNRSVVVLVVMLLLCMAAAVATLAYVTKKSPSVIHNSDMHIFNADSFAIFPADVWAPIPSESGTDAQRFTPTPEEARIALGAIEDAMRDSKDIQDLGNYKVQLVGFIDEKGEKNIWANFFCDDHDKDWKSQLVFVMDGGNNYFNVKVNLRSRKVYGLRINGEA